MIDTIFIRLEGDHKVNYNILDNIHEYQKDEQHKRISAYLKNLEIKKFENGVTIKGSLPKYIFGDNFNTFNRETLYKAILKLEKITKLPIRKGTVFRLDIGANLLLKENTYQYLKYLAKFGSTKVSTIDDGKTKIFKNKNRTLNFYDKIEDMHNEGIKVPEWILENNLHIMRYELQLKNSPTVKAVLNENKVLVRDIYSRETYNFLVYTWAQYYFNITRQKRITFKLDRKESRKNYKNIIDRLSMIGLEQIGIETVFTEIKRSNYKYKKKYDLISNIKKLSAIRESSDYSSIEELDKAIYFQALKEIDHSSALSLQKVKIPSHFLKAE